MLLPFAILYLIIKAAFFATLLKAFVSSETLQEKPWLMSIVWTAGVGGLCYVYFVTSGAVTMRYFQIWVGANLVLSFFYYWLLAKFEDVWVVWWTVLILGLGLVYPL